MFHSFPQTFSVEFWGFLPCGPEVSVRPCSPHSLHYCPFSKIVSSMQPGFFLCGSKIKLVTHSLKNPTIIVYFQYVFFKKSILNIINHAFIWCFNAWLFCCQCSALKVSEYLPCIRLSCRKEAFMFNSLHVPSSFLYLYQKFRHCLL